jgi:hypothetical protein
MRIRSIKPEFWTDENLSELSAETVLLAVALNNYADDEGYFQANPRLVEAALMPLRELSVKVPVSLSELSRVGWIELRTTSENRQIGRLCHFARDQVISHPKKSELRSLFSQAGKIGGNVPASSPDASGSIPAGMEGNGMEGNREGNREQGKEGKGGDPGEGERKRRKTQKSGSLNPAEQSEPIRSRMLAIGSLLRRMPSTRWSLEEFEAFKAAGLDTLSEQDFAAQAEPLRAYYGAAIPTERDFRRRDVLRVLRNWAGELDKAIAWTRDNNDGLTRT